MAHSGRVRWMLVASTALVLLVTLVPTPGAPTPDVSWTCLICGYRGLANALLNMALFMPLGGALAARGSSARASLGLGAALALVVELLQTVIPGRDPAAADILFNAVGTAAGFGAVATRAVWLRPSREAGVCLSLLALVAALAVFGFTAYALQPSLPATHYFGQWTPDLGHLAHYGGRVLSARLGPMPLPSHRLSDSDSARSLLASDAPLDVVAVAGPPSAGLASLFSIFDHRRLEIVLVGPDGDDLVYRYRTRAVELRLDQPDLRREQLLAGLTPGDTFRVRVAPGKDGRCLVLDGDEECMSFTVGIGWALLRYVEAFPAWLKSMLNAMWVALIVLPIGFWSQRTAWAVGLALPVLSALLLLPVISELGPTPLPEWLGAALGIVAGLRLRRIPRRAD